MSSKDLSHSLSKLLSKMDVNALKREFLQGLKSLNLIAVEKCLKRFPNLCNKPFSGILPLSFAFKHGSKPLANLLLDYGADPEKSCSYYAENLSAAHISAELGYIDLLKKLEKRLLHKPVEKGPFMGLRAVHFAAANNHVNILQFLPYESADNYHPMHLAAYYGAFDAYKFYYNKAKNIYVLSGIYEGMMPLHLAIITRQTKLIDWTIKHDKAALGYICNNSIFTGTAKDLINFKK